MTERDYFSYRYAVPGILFILLIILTNSDLVIGILAQHSDAFGVDVAALVAILTFLSAPSFGFVFVQLWYFSFDIFRVRLRFWNRTRDRLNEKGITSPDSWSDGMYVAKIDHWLQTKECSQLVSYLSKRWDLFHTFWSMVLSASGALTLGFILRIFCPDFLSGVSVSEYEFCLLRTISVASVLASLVLITVSIHGAMRVKDEHQNMIGQVLDHYDPKNGKASSPS